MWVELFPHHLHVAPGMAQLNFLAGAGNLLLERGREMWPLLDVEELQML